MCFAPQVCGQANLMISVADLSYEEELAPAAAYRSQSYGRLPEIFGNICK